MYSKCAVQTESDGTCIFIERVHVTSFDVPLFVIADTMTTRGDIHPAVKSALCYARTHTTIATYILYMVSHYITLHAVSLI